MEDYVPEDGRSEPDETTLENVRYLLGGNYEVSEDAADVPESEDDELDEVFFGNDLEERLSRIAEYIRSREDTKKDAAHLEFLAKVWSLKDSKALYEIYENRSFSIRAVEELIYYTLRWKDKELGPNQPLEEKDLIEVAESFLPTEVRNELNKETLVTLLRVGMYKSEVNLALGIEDEAEKEWFNQLSDADRMAVLEMRDEVKRYEGSVRGLYLIGWLLDQDFMKEYEERLRLSLAGRRRTVAEMLNQAMASVDTEGHLIIAARRRGPSQRVGFSREGQMHRFHRMVSAKRMCELVGLGKYRK